MATTLVPKLALASVAAVGLYAPILGLPLPTSATTSQPSPSVPESDKDSPLPKHFRIDSEGTIEECRVTGDKVDCTTRLDPMPDNYESWTATTTGTLSGLTMTGTFTIQEIFHQADEPSCRSERSLSGPVTYDFALDGTVVMSGGMVQVETRSSGSCPGASSGKSPIGQGTGLWSPIA